MEREIASIAVGLFLCILFYRLLRRVQARTLRNSKNKGNYNCQTGNPGL